MTDVFWIAAWISFFVCPFPGNLNVLSDIGWLGPLSFLSLPFAHAGISHILYNFLFGYPVMKLTEKYISKSSWLVLWLLTAFVTMYLKLYYIGLYPPALGASGVLMAYNSPALYFAATRERAALFPVIFFWLFTALLVFTNITEGDPVMLAHGGGFAVGSLFTVCLGIRSLKRRFF